MASVNSFKNMNQTIKNTAGVVDPSGPHNPVATKPAAPSKEVDKLSDPKTITPSAQTIKNSTGVTLPSGLPDLGAFNFAQAKTETKGGGDGSNSVGDTNVGNTGGPSEGTSLNGAYDVVSDFDYYKNKLDQDGTSALIKNKYESQVKQTATESARYVAENISKGNQSYEQSAYVAAQTADKLGWSGGYALDAARQVEYLRASIQADIFSQQELQKLGYKSNLEAAYASAELELNEQAQDNYYQAQEIAINQAQLTGKYIDPAIADMCIQASAAQDIMKSKDPSSEEYKKAEKVYNYMAANLKARGNVDKDKNVQITPVAIQTLTGIQMELEKLTLQDAQIKALNSIEESGGVAFPVIGDDGQIMNWTTSPDIAFNDNLAEFYRNQPGALETKVSRLMQNMLTGYATWLQTKDKDGNLVNNGKSFNDFLTTAYKNPSALTDLLNLVQPEGKNSYTMGDLTVTKGSDGKWTIGGTGTTSTGTTSTGTASNNGAGGSIVLKDNDGTEHTFDALQFGKDFNLTVNTNGVDLAYYTAGMSYGHNMSLKVPGEDEIYRVQVGRQVKYDTALDKALNNISTEANSIAYVGGTIFVRDNEAWYEVTKRAISYHKQWEELQSRLKEYFGEGSSEFAELLEPVTYDKSDYGQHLREQK